MEKSTSDLAGRADARRRREQRVSDSRRGLILDAARSAFIELGLQGASLREIAKRAGYTPGALYSYFDSKEEIYAALLDESLQRLSARIAGAGGAGALDAGLQARACALFDFYRDNPRELDLGFYLFRGIRPMGLTPALNRRLNRRLREALAPMQAALEHLGLPAAAAERETTALFAQILGLLVLNHSGRIRMFGQQPRQLLRAYVDRLRRAAVSA